MDLATLRKKIDETDEKIVQLFEERMLLSDNVATYKIEVGKAIFDKERENEKLQKIKEATHSSFNAKGAVELFSQIMAISRKYQYQKMQNGLTKKEGFAQVSTIFSDEMQIVYQGDKGSYSEEAMYRFFGEHVNCHPVPTFKSAIDEICEEKSDFAILPIENSTAGIVNEVYDLLVSSEAYIVGEIIIPIKHCLLGVSGAKIGDIERVYAHPQALMQSEAYLASHSKMSGISMKNNAFAAQKVAFDKDMSQAAIASERASVVYGLSILQQEIHDESKNSTRFIIVSKKKQYMSNAKKVSICLEIMHESGSLYRVLSHFIFNDLNMTKIESRPIRDRNWEYRFFIDFEGNLASASVQNALSGLKEETLNLKILGNY